MKKEILKKLWICSILMIFFYWLVNANDIDELKKSIDTLIQKYEEKIKVLEQDNNKLKKDIENIVKEIQVNSPWIYKNIENILNTWNNFENNSTKTNQVSNSWSAQNSWSIFTWSITNNSKHDKIIEIINNSSQWIYKENNLDSTSNIWLFEFIEPNHFFISIDDGKNPSWITAFKTKILFQYDNNYNLTKKWVFDFDLKLWLYKTIFWSNPFAWTIRIKVKNPIYKWKLLDDVKQDIINVQNQSTTTQQTQTTNTSQPTNTTTTTTETKNVTLSDIKSAYDKNKILDVIQLSNEYIKNDPNNINVLKMRYRSFYIIWKYTDSISEIQKIENIQKDNFEKIIACDATVIAKIAKNSELSTKYKEICNK